MPNGFEDCLLWSDELGRGFHTRQPIDYQQSYWDEYILRDGTPMGSALTAARVSLVEQFGNGTELCDIGIGGGRFVQQANAMGYDVNPEAVRWLKATERYRDPYDGPRVGQLTFWDSLEHIPNPELIVSRAEHLVFVSMPIYRDLADVLGSPHYKPGEHLHYWTDEGLRLWFENQGFRYLHSDDCETRIGRRGIMSYVFYRLRG